MEEKKSCVDCGSMHCSSQNSRYPDFCLSTEQYRPEVMEASLQCYEEELNHQMMIHAAEIEAEFYCRYNRVEETVEFAKRMGFKRIGIATCVGLMRESRNLSKILKSHGFEVFCVACKAGAVEKIKVGIDESCNKVGTTMCNPIHQAKRLAAEKTDLNIVVGLCVGHDILFNKYSEAPVTTLIAKDRVLAHNPAGALYTLHSYNKKMMEESS